MGFIKLTADKLKIKKLREVFLDQRDELIDNHDIIQWFFPVTRFGKRPLSKKETNVKSCLTIYILKKEEIHFYFKKVLFKNHYNLRHVRQSIISSLKVVFQSFGLIIRDVKKVSLQESLDFTLESRLFSEHSIILNQIFECLGEFGLVETQYALLNYFAEKIRTNKDLKLPYLNWIDALRDEEMKKGYLKLVCYYFLFFFKFIYKLF